MTIPTTFRSQRRLSPALAGLSLRVSPDAWGRSGLGANDGGKRGAGFVTSPRNHGVILYGRLFTAVGKSQSQTCDPTGGRGVRLECSAKAIRKPAGAFWDGDMGKVPHTEEKAMIS